jgi:DNA-binding NarL/FixJ family response regulator
MAFGIASQPEIDAMRAESQAMRRPKLVPRMIGRRERKPRCLSPRLVSIVRLMASGPGNKEIAQKLGLAEGTVKAYMNRIFSILGLKRRGELVAWAIEHAKELE